MKKYVCKECGKEVQLLKSHLKNQHKEMDIEQYLSKYNELEKYNQYMEESKILRQKRSPNSIYFYIEKGFTKEEAKIELDKYNLNNPWRRLDVSPSQELYWIKKGFTKEEAKSKSYLHNSNSLDNLIIKFGEIEGTKKYNNIQESFKGRKDKIINNLSKKYNCSFDDAYVLYKEQMKSISPKTVEYWIKKGYNEDEIKNILKQNGQNTSPRHIKYWLNKCNNDYDLATKLHYEYQDNCSIGSIIKKYNYTEDEAVEHQNKIIDKMLNTMQERGYIFKYNKNGLEKYRIIVRIYTEKTYRRYKHIIDPENKRGLEYHLDHKYSILQGFIDGIDEIIIGSLFNLEIIYGKLNCSKGKKCSITKQELIKNN